MTWLEVSKAVSLAEAAEGPHGCRVTLICCDAPKHPDLWKGVYGNAPISPGAACYRLSNGKVITL